MPKKRVVLNKRVIARNVRISERYKQSKGKVPEENPIQTDEDGENPKCKLRDVKNNKKKNDKKELSRLLFAKVVPENGPKIGATSSNAAPVNNANTNKNNAINNINANNNKNVINNNRNASQVEHVDNKLFAPPQKRAIKKAKIENTNGGNIFNKPVVKENKDLIIEQSNQNEIRVAPVINENISNLADKKTTQNQNGIKAVPVNNENASNLPDEKTTQNQNGIKAVPANNENASNLANKKTTPIQNGIEDVPVNNENASNLVEKKTTPNAPFNDGEKVVINYPKIFGSEVDENLALVPKNRMTYQDFLNTPGTTYFKYILNTECKLQVDGNSTQNNLPNTGPIAYPNAISGNRSAILNKNSTPAQMSQPSTSNASDLAENDDCVKIMAALWGYANPEEKEIAKKKNIEIWKNDLFTPNERMIIKYVSEQFLKLTETSNYLTRIRENLRHIVAFQGTKEFQELKKNEQEEIVITCENGTVYKLKESDIISKIKEVGIKEKELEILEVDVKQELNTFIKNFPNGLKNKLRIAAKRLQAQEENIPQVTSQTDAEQLVQLPQVEPENNELPSTSGCAQTVNNNCPSTSGCAQTINNKCPFKLSRKQKKALKKKMARNRRRLNNAAHSATEVLRENLNISNTTIDLPERNGNEAFEINFVSPGEDSDKENANVFQAVPNDRMEKRKILQNLLANINPYSPENNLNNSEIETVSDETAGMLLASHPNGSSSNATERLSEDNLRMILSPDERFLLVNMVKDRPKFNNVRRENYLKKYYSITENPRNVYKTVKHCAENRKKSVIKFINNNFPFIDNEGGNTTTTKTTTTTKSSGSDFNYSIKEDYEIITEDISFGRFELDPEIFCEDISFGRLELDPEIFNEDHFTIPNPVNPGFINEDFPTPTCEVRPEMENEDIAAIQHGMETTNEDILIVHHEEDPEITNIYEDLQEMDPEVINEVIPVVRREVAPEVQERMDQYEYGYFDINITAIYRSDEYDDKRKELNEKFADLFEMNYIDI